MRRFLIPLIVFAVLVAFLGVGLTLRPDAVPSPLVGRPAPELSGEALRDPERTISLEQRDGGVAVVNVWASWCTACVEEHPYVMALAEEVPVYGLNYKDQREKAIAWLERNGDSYMASVFDPEGEIGLDWGVYGVPETYVIDAEGIIRRKHIGAITERDLREELLPLIAELRAEAES